MRIYATLAALAAVPQLGAQTTGVSIDTLLIREVTAVLAHDSLKGRGTGTGEAETAARYIARICERLGLEPVGESYLHPVPLELRTLTPATTLTVSLGERSTDYHLPGDFVPGFASRDNLTGFAGPLVVVGTSKEIEENPGAYAALDGRVAVAFSVFRDSVAPAILKRAGVTGVVSLLGNEQAFEFYQDFLGIKRVVVAEDGLSYSMIPPLPNVILSPALSRSLVAATHVTAPPQAPLETPLTLQLTVADTTRPLPGHNVICSLRGTDPVLSDSAIVFTAHYDHLGIGKPDASGDSVYNGFSDNAAGVAMLLAIGKDLERAPLKRTALFAFFVGEERGLLGSDYYVAHPAWSLERLNAVINLDAGAPPAPPLTWRIAGGTGTELGSLAVRVADQAGWSATTSAARANSDYYPFARKGVPAIFIVPGTGPYEGMSAEASKALKDRWDAYHQASDEFHEDFPFSGVQRYANYALLIARARDGG